MGIDITAFVDVYPNLNVDIDEMESCYIQCFGKIFLQRDTKLFALLAGVGHFEEEIKPVIAARGIPIVSSWQVQSAYTVIAIDDHKWTLGHVESSYPRYCKRSQANEYVSNKESKYLNKYLGEIIDPDAHTFSWLTAKELEGVQHQYEQLTEIRQQTIESLRAVIALMKALDGEQVGRSRLVFWFEGGKAGEQAMIDKVVEVISRLELD